MSSKSVVGRLRIINLQIFYRIARFEQDEWEKKIVQCIPRIPESLECGGTSFLIREIDR